MSTSSTNTPPTTSPSSHSSTHTSHSTTQTSSSTRTSPTPSHSSLVPPVKVDNPNQDHSSPGSALGFTIFAILIVLIIAIALYILWRHWSARQRGLPPPPLNPFSDQNRAGGSRGGVVSWVQDKISGLRRQRRAGGAYEGTGLGSGLGASGGRRRGFGAALDPDEAWDTRVGTEADVYGPGPYEEQELSGLRRHDGGAYTGSEYSRPVSSYRRSGSLDEISIGETGVRTTEFDQRYEEEMGRRGRPGAIGSDPFGDTAETSNMSLRGISPRPHEDEGERKGGLQRTAEAADSPTERRSMFRENV